MSAPPRTLRGGLPVWLLERREVILVAHHAVGDPRMVGLVAIGNTVCGLEATRFEQLHSYHADGLGGVQRFCIDDLVEECPACAKAAHRVDP